jgi:hypothetical protein
MLVVALAAVSLQPFVGLVAVAAVSYIEAGRPGGGVAKRCARSAHGCPRTAAGRGVGPLAPLAPGQRHAG